MSKIYCIGDEEELCEDLQKNYNARIKAELEEIKGRIIACYNQENGIESDFYNKGLDIAIKILDNYINKADCNNDCEHCEWTECPKD